MITHIGNNSACRCALTNLFHACMMFILHPLEKLGLTGLHLQSRDGAIHDCHPVFATHIGNYLEQILVTAIKTGKCPVCPAKGDEVGDPDCIGEPCDLTEILDVLNSINKGATKFTHACKAAGISLFNNLSGKTFPLFTSITPSLPTSFTSSIKALLSM